jgi:hypothetical protein
MLSLNSVHEHGTVRNDEIELLATLKAQDAAKDRGHFRLFGTLAISHMAHPGSASISNRSSTLQYHGCLVLA